MHTYREGGTSLRVSEVFKWMIKRLQPDLGDHALQYTEQILQHVLSCTRSQLYLDSGLILSEASLRSIDTIIKRCHTGEPLEYILGTAYFYNREFTVSPAVLIPRPDTEVLVEVVLESELQQTALFADIGVGSGIISCILTEQKKEWTAIGIEYSIDALEIARLNVKNKRIQLVCADFLSVFSAHRQFDFIVSNPPYIPTKVIDTLALSVKAFEPHRALDGGTDGLHYYYRLAEEAPKFLKKGGTCYCEIGYDQEMYVSELFAASGWKDITCRKDLCGHARVIIAHCGY